MKIAMDGAIVPQLAVQLLDDVAEAHVDDSKLSNETLLDLHSIFGNVLGSALELLENCTIVQYQTSSQLRKVYKIGDRKQKYTVFNRLNFCQCPQFRGNILEDRDLIMCKHVLALRLSQILKMPQIKTEIVTDSQFVEFLNEQINCLDEK